MSGKRGTRFQDITVSLSPDIPAWPGDTAYSCGWTSLIRDGSSVNVSAVVSSPHVGTHADAPLHVKDSAPGSETLSLDAFMGDAVIVDVSATRDEIAVLPDGVGDRVERLLLKTGRCVADGTFPDNWAHLSEECARELLRRGLRLLAVDAPSVDHRDSKSLSVHKILFGGGACVVENLDLRSVQPGSYELIALPMRLKGVDAAPVRALLASKAWNRGAV